MPDRLDIDGLLIDIDGVLVLSWDPIEGAPAALDALRRSGVPLRFATNTTTRTRADVASRLSEVGMPAEPTEILTAPAATAAHLRAAHPGARCRLLNAGDITADFDGIELVDEGPADVVVLGGAGDEFTYGRLDDAFRLLLDGAAFVAMHRNLYWRTSDGLQLDSGAYVQALEAASGVTATVLGKPSVDFFTTGVNELGVATERVAMVGDDIDNDVLGAQHAGLTGVLVRTGKFEQRSLDEAAERPDVVIDAFADLPDLLAR